MSNLLLTTYYIPLTTDYLPLTTYYLQGELRLGLDVELGRNPTDVAEPLLVGVWG